MIDEALNYPVSETPGAAIVADESAPGWGSIDGGSWRHRRAVSKILIQLHLLETTLKYSYTC